jgi:hypothetical protein
MRSQARCATQRATVSALRTVVVVGGQGISTPGAEPVASQRVFGHQAVGPRSRTSLVSRAQFLSCGRARSTRGADDRSVR